jgi:hypothetical protein
MAKSTPPLLHAIERGDESCGWHALFLSFAALFFLKLFRDGSERGAEGGSKNGEESCNSSRTMRRSIGLPKVHFPSMAALQQCAASRGARETLANAAKISTGGSPIILIAEEDTFEF